jgi:hypothetical protein
MDALACAIDFPTERALLFMRDNHSVEWQATSMDCLTSLGFRSTPYKEIIDSARKTVTISDHRSVLFTRLVGNNSAGPFRAVALIPSPHRIHPCLRGSRTHISGESLPVSPSLGRGEMSC